MIVDDGWPIARAAERYEVSWPTAKRWAERYAREGGAGMADRSSRPHHSPSRTPQPMVRKVQVRRHDLDEPLGWLPDSAVDLSVMALVIHYVPDRVAALRELHHVLHPHGRLVISTTHPTADWLLDGGSYFDAPASITKTKIRGSSTTAGSAPVTSAPCPPTASSRSPTGQDVIKPGGEWISSVELENHLMAHPDVVEATVVGVPDDRWDERPLASVVLRPGASAGLADLQDFIATRVAKWQVPERWAIITEVPKTSVGKFDKKVLRKQHAAGALHVVELP